MFQSKEPSNIKASRKVLTARFAGLAGKAPNFKKTSCILLVSVGKENFEGSALEAQLKLINAEFNDCIILVADTLQRYNFLASYTEILSEEKAREVGSEWINRHNHLFKQHLTNINYEICRWDEWIEKEGFLGKKIMIEQQLNSDSIYIEAMNKSINEFVTRCQKRITPDQFFNELEITENCKNYLIEECAVLLMLGEENYQYIVYPGKETPILAATLDFIHQQKSDCLKVREKERKSTN